jgi:hypothetical protein
MLNTAIVLGLSDGEISLAGEHTLRELVALLKKTLLTVQKRAKEAVLMLKAMDPGRLAKRSLTEPELVLTQQSPSSAKEALLLKLRKRIRPSSLGITVDSSNLDCSVCESVPLSQSSSGFGDLLPQAKAD